MLRKLALFIHLSKYVKAKYFSKNMLDSSCTLNESASIDMTCNTKKTVSMVFQPKWRDRIIAAAFPLIKINENDIQYVSEFRYLGHIINNRLTDENVINREIKNMFTRTNVLPRRFSKCSVSVKITLFKSYCMSFYDSALWRTYLKGSFQELRSCYNKCLKMFFGYSRRFQLNTSSAGFESIKFRHYNCKQFCQI